MPLSAPCDREHIHTRTVECRGYRRADGLWDIEGVLTDTKTYDFPNKDRGGAIVAGDAIHGMAMRVTVDEDLLIHAVEATIDDSPFAVCPAIAPKFSQLAGTRIGPGFTSRIKQLFGGTGGCTHLAELLRPIATTAYQTIVPLRRRTVHEDGVKKPGIIDSCHALDSAGPVVKREWPEYYTGPDPEG